MSRNLVIRSLSAFVVLGIIYSLYWSMAVDGLMAFGFIVIALGVYEYKKMVLEDHLNCPKTFSLCFYLISLMSLILFYTLSLSPFVYLSLFFLSFVSICLHRKTENVENALNEISYSFIGFFYTLVFPFFILKILSLPEIGVNLFVSLLAITFAGDSLAYFCGRFLGKRLVVPSISPKKTVAGSVGGLIASCLAGALLLHTSWNIASLPIALFTGLICGLSAQMGDFFESLLKRVCGVKDSGSIMPGHGGVLDRVDGLYFAAPVFYAIYYIFII